MKSRWTLKSLLYVVALAACWLNVFAQAVRVKVIPHGGVWFVENEMGMLLSLCLVPIVVSFWGRFIPSRALSPRD